MKRTILFIISMFLCSIHSVWAESLPDGISIKNLNFHVVNGSIDAGIAPYDLPSTEGEYGEGDFVIVNNSDAPFRVSFHNFYIRANNRSYAPSNLSIYFKNSLYFTTINPGISKKASILFEIPKGIKDLDFRYTSSPNP